MKIFSRIVRLWQRLFRKRQPYGEGDALVAIEHAVDRFKSADDEGKGAILRFLITALEDDNPELKEKAFNALVALDAEAVPELLRALRENEALRRDIAIILSEIGDPAVEGLLALLNAQDEMIKWAVVWALGEIGDPRAYEPLLKLLGEEGSLFFLQTVQEAVEKIMQKNNLSYP